MIVAALALINAAGPPSAVQRLHILGVGNNSCRQWLVAEQTRDVAAIENLHWLSGFISGANLIELASGGESLTQPGDTLEAAAANIHIYCAAHPSDLISTAAQHFVMDTLERNSAAILKGKR